MEANDLNFILSIVSICISILAFVLSIIFFKMGHTEQTKATATSYETIINNTKNLDHIKAIVETVKDTGDKTNNKLLDYVLNSKREIINSFVKGMDEEITDDPSFDNSIIKEKFENFKRFSEKFNQIDDLNYYNIIELAKKLDDISRNELKVLYLLYEQKFKDIPNVDNFNSFITIGNNEIKIIIQKLKKCNLINDDNKINIAYINIISNIFEIDEYTGMSLDEKITKIKEQLKRLLPN
jgi:sulfite reductase beta subunit-like hemoprotein